MQYILLFTEPAEMFVERDQPEHAGPYWAGWKAYIGAMTQAGVIVRGDALRGPQMATTVRVRDGRRQVQDGPVADSKEQLGGYVVIEVPDLDTALEWAARSPAAAHAAVEVRPLLPPTPPDA